MLTKDERFDNTDYIVEANSFEHMSIYSDRYKFKGFESWKEDNVGIHATVGVVNDLPVCVDVRWSIVNGMSILFWSASSRMVDYDMIEEWFKENCNCDKKTDAMNFNQVFRMDSDGNAN